MKLPGQFYKKAKSAGFTMIELLVVIAIIGILAVAVLSAINPVEQLNKGSDTGARADAAELLGGVERYYAVQEKYPWAVTRTTAPTWTADVDAFTSGTTVASLAWMNTMSDVDEIKKTLINRVAKHAGDTIKQLKLYYEVPPSSIMSICFVPESKQFKAEAAARCLADPSSMPGVACSGADKMICIP